MKLTHKIIKLVFSLFVIVIGQNAFGQIPPYQHSTSKMLRESLEPGYYLTFGKEWIQYYLREDIPFYTMFNYTNIEDYNFETNFQRFYFRKFSSFTAPKGVKKITYYLGNNLIDSTKATTHVFYFNKKTNLLERELEYEKDSLGLNHKKEYSYKYEETDQKTIVKKLIKVQDSLILINKYIYSKDKTKLLKNEFLAWDYQFELLTRSRSQLKSINEVGRIPITKKMQFIYDDKNNLKEPIYFEAKNSETLADYNENIYNYGKSEPHFHGWSVKKNWLSLLNKSEKEGELISFPKQVDLKVHKSFLFRYKDERSSELTNTINYIFWVQSEQSNNLYISKYHEEDKYMDSYHFYTNHKILLFDDYNKLSNAYIVNNYHLAAYNRTFRKKDNTPLDYILISKIENKNNYTIKHIQKEILYFNIDYLDTWLWGDKYLSSFKNEESYIKNELYTLELKPKKGINEIYLIKDNKKYPLITIN